MAAIAKDFGAGGVGIEPGSKSPTVAEAFRDIADDLDVLRVPTITSPDATDEASAVTLVNEIKAKLNALAAVVIKTTKA